MDGTVLHGVSRPPCASAPVTGSLHGNSEGFHGLFTGRDRAPHSFASAVQSPSETSVLQAIEPPVRPMRCANLELVPSGLQLLVDGRSLDLTAREFQLL